MYASTSGEPGIGALLGFKSPEDIGDFDLVKRVEAGISPAAVGRVARRILPDDATLMHRIVPKTTLERRRRTKTPLTKDESETVVSLARVAMAAEKVFQGDSSKAQRFLTRPHPLLDRRTPIDVAIGSTLGAELVIEMLESSAAGVAI